MLLCSIYLLIIPLPLFLLPSLSHCLHFPNKNVMNRLIFWPPAMQRGQYDRFITHGFMHADGTHLLFNMITLFFFGSIIESFYRQYMYDLGFVLFYLGGLIAAIIPSYLKHKNDHRWASLGALVLYLLSCLPIFCLNLWKLIFVFLYSSSSHYFCSAVCSL